MVCLYLAFHEVGQWVFVSRSSWKHVLINYTPALEITFDGSVSGGLLRSLPTEQ